MIKAIFNPNTEGKVFNLATGHDYSIEEIVTMVADILGKKLEIKSDKKRVRPDRSEVRRLQGDSKLAAKMIGYKPHYQLRDGLAETIAFFERNMNLYKKEEYQL
jgi:nucleoside-diphosphate-sugar epimerase